MAGIVRNVVHAEELVVEECYVGHVGGIRDLYKREDTPLGGSTRREEGRRLRAHPTNRLLGKRPLRATDRRSACFPADRTTWASKRAAEED